MSGNDSATSGKQAGTSLGGAVKGITNIAGGVGEAVRGNFNDFADQAGEGLASAGESKEAQAKRQAELQNSSSGTRPGENAKLAQEGTNQFQQGIRQLTGGSSGK